MYLTFRFQMLKLLIFALGTGLGLYGLWPSQAARQAESKLTNAQAEQLFNA